MTLEEQRPCECEHREAQHWPESQDKYKLRRCSDLGCDCQMYTPATTSPTVETAGCKCKGDMHDESCRCTCTDHRKDPLCQVHQSKVPTVEAATEKNFPQIDEKCNCWHISLRKRRTDNGHLPNCPMATGVTPKAPTVEGEPTEPLVLGQICIHCDLPWRQHGATTMSCPTGSTKFWPKYPKAVEPQVDAPEQSVSRDRLRRWKNGFGEMSDISNELLKWRDWAKYVPSPSSAVVKPVEETTACKCAICSAIDTKFSSLPIKHFAIWGALSKQQIGCQFSYSLEEAEREVHRSEPSATLVELDQSLCPVCVEDESVDIVSPKPEPVEETTAEYKKGFYDGVHAEFLAAKVSDDISEFSPKQEPVPVEEVELPAIDDIEDRGLELFIAEREAVAAEWSIDRDRAISAATMAGIDAEVNTRICRRLIIAEHKLAVKGAK
jgi:hypothetical protein